MSLWTDKYKPTNIKEIVGNVSAIQKSLAWLHNFQNGIPNTKRALFISGNPGIGKTTFANLLLQEANYELVEFNASDIRNQKLVKEKFKNIMGKVSISSLMGGAKFIGIIMDEVDGMSSGDKGGLSELITFVNPNKGKKKKDKLDLPYQNPIICICNEDQEKKLQDLKKECECVPFYPPKSREIYDFATQVIKKENIEMNDDQLLDLVKFCQQDVRKLLGTLEYLCCRHNKTNANNTIEVNLTGLDKKQEDERLFDSVYKVLDKYYGVEETVRICNTDRSLINLLVHENILNIMSNYQGTDTNKLQTMETIYSYMKESDVLDSYLYNNFNNEISEVNSILRCGTTSYYLNQQKIKKTKEFHSQDIIFSKLLSKFSIQHQNYKAKMTYNNKIILSNNFKDNHLLYYIIIKKIILSNNNNILDPQIKQLVETYDFDCEDFEKIYKLIKSRIKISLTNLHEIYRLVDLKKTGKKNKEDLLKIQKLVTNNISLDTSESNELQKLYKHINSDKVKATHLDNTYKYLKELIKNKIGELDLTIYSKCELDKKYFTKYFKKFQL